VTQKQLQMRNLMTVENKTKKFERCGRIVVDQLLCKIDSINVRFMIETSEAAS